LREKQKWGREAREPRSETDEDVQVRGW